MGGRAVKVSAFAIQIAILIEVDTMGVWSIFDPIRLCALTGADAPQGVAQQDDSHVDVALR